MKPSLISPKKKFWPRIPCFSSSNSEHGTMKGKMKHLGKFWGIFCASGILFQKGLKQCGEVSYIKVLKRGNDSVHDDAGFDIEAGRTQLVICKVTQVYENLVRFFNKIPAKHSTNVQEDPWRGPKGPVWLPFPP